MFNTIDGTLCTPTCPAKYYNDSNMNCAPCDPSCETCTNYTSADCTSCVNGSHYASPNLNRNPNTTAGTCLPCDNSCGTCNGPNSTHCLSCKTGLILRGSACELTTCMDGYYFDTVNFDCAGCDASCATCYGQGNGNCSSCTGNLMLLKGVCYTCAERGIGFKIGADGKCHGTTTFIFYCLLSA